MIKDSLIKEGIFYIARPIVLIGLNACLMSNCYIFGFIKVSDVMFIS